jgi:hypothetical protein
VHPGSKIRISFLHSHIRFFSLPGTAQFCRILPLSAGFCPILTGFDRIFPSSVGLITILSGLLPDLRWTLYDGPLKSSTFRNSGLPIVNCQCGNCQSQASLFTCQTNQRREPAPGGDPKNIVPPYYVRIAPVCAQTMSFWRFVFRYLPAGPGNKKSAKKTRVPKSTTRFVRTNDVLRIHTLRPERKLQTKFAQIRSTKGVMPETRRASNLLLAQR